MCWGLTPAWAPTGLHPGSWRSWTTVCSAQLTLAQVPGWGRSTWPPSSATSHCRLFLLHREINLLEEFVFSDNTRLRPTEVQGESPVPVSSEPTPPPPHPHTPWPVWASPFHETLPSLTYVSWVFLSCDSGPSCHHIPLVTLGQCGWAAMSGLGDLIIGCSVWGPNTETVASPGARLAGSEAHTLPTSVVSAGRQGRWAGDPGERASHSQGERGRCQV